MRGRQPAAGSHGRLLVEQRRRPAQRRVAAARPAEDAEQPRADREPRVLARVALLHRDVLERTPLLIELDVVRVVHFSLGALELVVEAALPEEGAVLRLGVVGDDADDGAVEDGVAGDGGQRRGGVERARGVVAVQAGLAPRRQHVQRLRGPQRARRPHRLAVALARRRRRD